MRLDEHTSLQPDVLVARLSDITTKRLPGPPLLAVEVASPSTRLLDLNFKRARLESAGCPAYWVVDPATPSLTAWELGADGRYTRAAHVEGTEEFTAGSPFTVTIAPQSLVSR
ncbi:MAG: Uma2 family endonuclease [Actinomycetales bacterium]|nr:Uma2 family endonuclease [Actinomycetales bacterium]